MPTCPDCRGEGSSFALLYGVRNGRRFCEEGRLECRACDGTGRITEEHAARIAEGERRRKDRIARGLSCREEAKRLGMDPIELNHLEHGRVREAARREGLEEQEP